MEEERRTNILFVIVPKIAKLLFSTILILVPSNIYNYTTIQG
jgi:hypothetical protein